MCLLVASKQDELDDRIPLIREIQKLARYEFSYRECQVEEEKVLRDLNFNVQLMSPLNILEALIGMGVIFEDDKVKCPESGSLLPVADENVLRRVRRAS